ncbi:MAG: hypothetical protein C7B47_12050 [Sulfobacillus thermosulfidooxidans]|uniref:Uncharacterized protein n=1 Tax=Sulfobacillus thermosulfidooxidans TaxID=28034 RepID=A0A2T2WT93_SULTH|nr:MAG: hypothetical protein C7B47_12050 [Sulfobacillus thermosulfidooxidans]
MAATTTAYGPWGYYGPYDGYSYENQSAVEHSKGAFSPWTYVKTQNGALAPAEYMGANALV